ncbi:MAG TPA: hypothetical protein VG365_02430 [Solirubrobacteraceae bacterium]|nr:hypothetical protein [Solirubrobacteraceae bacterium]
MEPDSRTAQVLFELEQFEVIDGDRCEVRGRWLGIRGRRFLRPVLTFTVDGRSMRLLADLAGKPWDAEDGGPWQASFPCALTGTELVGAELSVAPDLTVALQSRSPTRPKSAPVADRAARGPAPHATDQSHGRATPSPFERRSRADAGERLQRELVDARTEQRRLQNQADHLRVEKDDSAQRIKELNTQAGKVKRELDTVTRAHERLAAELQRVAGERDEALFQLDAMTAKRDAARYDYAELVRKLKAQEAAHQQTLADRDRAIADQDEAKAAPDAAVAKSAKPARANDRRPSPSRPTIRDPAPPQRRTTRPRPGTRSHTQSFRYAGPAVALLVITLLVTLIVLRP